MKRFKNFSKKIQANNISKMISPKNHNNSFFHFILFYLSISLALVCWIFTLSQFISNNTVSSHDAIPAYKTQSTVSYSNKKFFKNINTDNEASKQKQLLTYLKKQDSAIQCVSSHKEKNYTDYYFYSPALAACMKTRPYQNFNLQVAVTKKNIYFGSPFIQTTF